jgi:hypothetical protein
MVVGLAKEEGFKEKIWHDIQVHDAGSVDARE